MSRATLCSVGGPGKQGLALSRHKGGPMGRLMREWDLLTSDPYRSQRRHWHLLWVHKCWSSVGWLERGETGASGQGSRT